MSNYKIRIITLTVIAIILTVTSFSPVSAHDYYVPGGTTPIGPEAPKPAGGSPQQNPTTGGEPVLLNTGEYVLSTQDISIQGRKLSLIIERNYRNQSEYHSRFGCGWDMYYNIKVRKLHDLSTLIVLDGQNRKLDYTLDSNSDPNTPVYISPAGRYDYIQENVDGTCTMFKKHGTKLDFDINGNLTTLTDRNGNSITFEYDPAGLLPLNGYSDYFVGQTYGLIALEFKLTVITDDLGREINLSYNSDGRVSAITDFAGRTWVYTYDPSTSDLLSVTAPATSQYPLGLTTTYSYDNHNLISVTDPKGQTYLVNHYDADDKVDWQTYGDGNYTFAYDPDNSTTTVTDRKGFQKETVYNEAGNPVSETVFTQGLRATDPASYMTNYQHNADLERTQVVFPKGNCINYAYDDKGNLLEICSKADTAIAHDDPNNLITVFTYDPNFNFVKTITDPNDNITTYTYDYEDINYGTTVGNLMKITYPTAGAETPEVNFTYNEFGQLETAIASDGIVTKYEYYDVSDPDGHGLLKKTIKDFGTDPNCLNITTEFRYDLVGNVVEATDAQGNITQLEYDNQEQLTQTVTPVPFNYVTNFSYDENGNLSQTAKQTDISGQPWQVTGFTYNILDNLETTTDPLGHVTAIGYDENENRSLVTDAEDNNSVSVYDERDLLWKVTDSLGNTTEYSYDENGNLKTIKDAKGNTTTYTYDDFDRLITVTYPDDSNEIYTYDKNSNLTDKTNRKGQITSYGYDELNRLTKRIPPDDADITYTYDIASRLTDINNGGLVTSYEYDRLNRIAQITYPNGKQVAYEYDSLGRRTKLTYPDSSFITYQYDQLSRLTDIVDDSNNVLAHYSYDALSRRAEAVFANWAGAAYDYDIADRLTNLSNSGNLWTKSFDYTYDNVGNRLTRTVDSIDIHDYTYDNIYQLTDVAYPDTSTVNYNYDALGNRISVINGGTTNYIFNNVNQYTSVAGVSLTYDDNGNLTADGTNSYIYDSQNRVISALTPAHTVSYEYDYSGRRISKTVDGVVTKFAYDGVQVIAEYDASDTLLRKYIYGPGIDKPIAMTSTGGTYYYAFDGLGSVVVLSDSVGSLAETYSYDVFGQPNSPSSLGNPYLFTGRRFDDETGLYYYRARYYDPYIGRFLQTDPTGYIDSLNLYTYVGNNPVTFVDPLGLFMGIEECARWYEEQSEKAISEGSWVKATVWDILGKSVGASGSAAKWYASAAERAISRGRGWQATAFDVLGGYVGGSETRNQQLAGLAWSLADTLGSFSRSRSLSASLGFMKSASFKTVTRLRHAGRLSLNFYGTFDTWRDIGDQLQQLMQDEERPESKKCK